MLEELMGQLIDWQRSEMIITATDKRDSKEKAHELVQDFMTRLMSDDSCRCVLKEEFDEFE